METLEGVLQKGPPQPAAWQAAAAAVEMKPAAEVERPHMEELQRRPSDVKAPLVPPTLRNGVKITYHDDIPYASISSLAKLKDSKMAVVNRSPRPFALERDSYLVSCLLLEMRFPDGSSNTYPYNVLPRHADFAQASRLTLYYVRLLNSKADGWSNEEKGKLDGIRVRSTILERDVETGSFGLSIKPGAPHSIADYLQYVSNQKKVASTDWKEEYAQLQCFIDKEHFFRPQQGDSFFTMPRLTLSKYVAVRPSGSWKYLLCAYASDSAAAAAAHAERDADLDSARAGRRSEGQETGQLGSKFVSSV